MRVSAVLVCLSAVFRGGRCFRGISSCFFRLKKVADGGLTLADDVKCDLVHAVSDLSLAMRDSVAEIFPSLVTHEDGQACIFGDKEVSATSTEAAVQATKFALIATLQTHKDLLGKTESSSLEAYTSTVTGLQAFADEHALSEELAQVFAQMHIYPSAFKGARIAARKFAMTAINEFRAKLGAVATKAQHRGGMGGRLIGAMAQRFSAKAADLSSATKLPTEQLQESIDSLLETLQTFQRNHAMQEGLERIKKSSEAAEQEIVKEVKETLLMKVAEEMNVFTEKNKEYLDDTAKSVFGKIEDPKWKSKLGVELLKHHGKVQNLPLINLELILTNALSYPYPFLL